MGSYLDRDYRPNRVPHGQCDLRNDASQISSEHRSSLETIIAQGPISVSRPNTSDTIQSEQPNEETDFEHGVDPLLQIHSDGNSANTIIQVNI